MSTLMRRAGIGAVALCGLLAGVDAAWAQNPYGYNPYLAQRQYLYNLQMGRAAYANSMANPSPAFGMPYSAPAYNPYMAFGGNPYLASGANPYLPATPGVAVDPGLAAGSNPYAPIGAG